MYFVQKIYKKKNLSMLYINIYKMKVNIIFFLCIVITYVIVNHNICCGLFRLKICYLCLNKEREREKSSKQRYENEKGKIIYEKRFFFSFKYLFLPFSESTLLSNKIMMIISIPN